MKVNLIKVAEYDLDENKVSKMDYNVFEKMTGKTDVTVSEYPSVRVFGSIEEFRVADSSNFDKTKEVHILKNGNVCVFLKDNHNETTEVNTNGTADTKENTRK